MKISSKGKILKQTVKSTNPVILVLLSVLLVSCVALIGVNMHLLKQRNHYRMQYLMRRSSVDLENRLGDCNFELHKLQDQIEVYNQEI
jgi:hypothetical protein